VVVLQGGAAELPAEVGMTLTTADGAR
jgi:hypothetical protein